MKGMNATREKISERGSLAWESSNGASIRIDALDLLEILLSDEIFPGMVDGHFVGVLLGLDL
jgi:hypothetical protein